VCQFKTQSPAFGNADLGLDRLEIDTEEQTKGSTGFMDQDPAKRQCRQRYSRHSAKQEAASRLWKEDELHCEEVATGEDTEIRPRIHVATTLRWKPRLPTCPARGCLEYGDLESGAEYVSKDSLRRSHRRARGSHARYR